MKKVFYFLKVFKVILIICSVTHECIKQGEIFFKKSKKPLFHQRCIFKNQIEILCHNIYDDKLAIA